MPKYNVLQLFKIHGAENYLPSFCSFGLHLDPYDGSGKKVVHIVWKAAPGSKIQVYHTTGMVEWEERGALVEVPPWGSIGDTAHIATGPWTMAFLVR